MIEKIYDTICETNDKLITEGKVVENVCFFIKDEDSTAMPIVYTKNKLAIQQAIKSYAVRNADGYIIITNTLTTMKNNKTGAIQSGDCIMRALYTPKRKITELVWYNDGKILLKERFEGRTNVRDFWDAWNEAGIEVMKRG